MRRPWWCRPSFWRVTAPLLLFFATLVTGMLGGTIGHFQANNGGMVSAGLETKTVAEKCWNTVGHLIGQTNFGSIKESGFAGVLVGASRLLGMLLVAWAFLMIVREEYGDILKRTRLWFWRRRGIRHVVVCGAGDAGDELARRLLAEKKCVALIEKNAECRSLADLRACGAVVFVGDALSAGTLRKAGLGNANEAYVVCGSDETNSRVAAQVERTFEALEGGCWQLERPRIDAKKGVCSDDCGKRFIVHVRLEQRAHRAALTDGAKSRRVAVHCFSFAEMTARSLFLKQGWVPRQRKGGAGPRHVHSVIFGATEVAQAVLLQNLKMLHLRDGDERVVSVVCRDHDGVRERVWAETPCLRPSGEMEESMRRVCENLFPALEFIELPESAADMRTTAFAPFRNIGAGWRLNVFFCLDEGTLSQGLMEALHGYLAWRAEKAGNDFELRCFCLQSRYEERANADALAQGAILFGGHAALCTPGAIIAPEADQIAKEIMMFYDDKYGKQEIESHRGQPHFECYVDRKWAVGQQEWERESNRQAADHIGVKLALLGLGWTAADGERLRTLLEDKASGALDLLARLEHRRWCAERLLGGWRPLPPGEDRRPWFKKGEERSPSEAALISRLKNDLRWHADLIPFEELPDHERNKDYGMIGNLPALLSGKQR